MKILLWIEKLKCYFIYILTYRMCITEFWDFIYWVLFYKFCVVVEYDYKQDIKFYLCQILITISINYPKSICGSLYFYLRSQQCLGTTPGSFLKVDS